MQLPAAVILRWVEYKRFLHDIRLQGTCMPKNPDMD